ncbi:MAG: hypothetical protein ACOCRX_04160 [Candidatus Woesearchaeota archaeon]
MTEEQEGQTQNVESEKDKYINDLIDEVNAIRFFGDSIKFNSTLHSGIEIILKKLDRIIDKLDKINDNVKN